MIKLLKTNHSQAINLMCVKYIVTRVHERTNEPVNVKLYRLFVGVQIQYVLRNC